MKIINIIAISGIFLIGSLAFASDSHTSEHGESTAVAAASHSSGHGAAVSSKISAREALNLLKEGNRHFAEGHMQHPNISRARRDDTMTNGQHPFAAVVTCSDSRVPAELIFDRGIGDIFIIRVAGNVISDNETGSVEYAAEHLNVPVVVVLGHTECGAVTAAVKGGELPGKIRTLVEQIQPAVAEARESGPDLQGVYMIRAAIKENVKLGIKNLEEKSFILKELAEKGELKILGAIYNIYTGEVEWMEKG